MTFLGLPGQPAQTQTHIHFFVLLSHAALASWPAAMELSKTQCTIEEIFQNPRTLEAGSKRWPILGQARVHPQLDVAHKVMTAGGALSEHRPVVNHRPHFTHVVECFELGQDSGLAKRMALCAQIG